MPRDDEDESPPPERLDVDDPLVPRELAEPDRLPDDVGVREPRGIWRAGNSGPPEDDPDVDVVPEDPDEPEDPEDPDEPDEPDPVVRGMACAAAVTGTAKATATAQIISERGDRVIAMHSFNRT